MGLSIGVVCESNPRETRAPLVPGIVAKYTDLGATLVAERNAATGLNLGDEAFENVPLYLDNTRMLYGDGQKVAADLIHAVKAV